MLSSSTEIYEPIIIVKLSRNPNPTKGREFIKHTEEEKKRKEIEERESQIITIIRGKRIKYYLRFISSLVLGAGVAATIYKNVRKKRKKKKTRTFFKYKHKFHPQTNISPVTYASTVICFVIFFHTRYQWGDKRRKAFHAKSDFFTQKRVYRHVW